MDGRMRWSRLENLFEESSKSQDYDPAQVRCRAAVQACGTREQCGWGYTGAVQACGTGGVNRCRCRWRCRQRCLEAVQAASALQAGRLDPPALLTWTPAPCFLPVRSCGCWRSGCAARAGAPCASRWPPSWCAWWTQPSPATSGAAVGVHLPFSLCMSACLSVCLCLPFLSGVYVSVCVSGSERA